LFGLCARPFKTAMMAVLHFLSGLPWKSVFLFYFCATMQPETVTNQPSAFVRRKIRNLKEKKKGIFDSI
jgi:hypothetical protein